MPCPESNQPSQIDLAHARRAAIEELFDEAIHADHRARLSQMYATCTNNHTHKPGTPTCVTAGGS